jgi:hypothetical protein
MSLTIWSVENAAHHVGFWPHTGEAAGLGLAVLGVVLVVAVGRGWWLPGGFEELVAKEHGSVVSPSVPATAEPASPPLPVDVRIVPEVDGDRLMLLIRNQGARGRFTAGVTSILVPPGWPAPGQHAWPIPWLADNPMAPADIPYSDARTLDFARFDAGESSGWDKRASWWFCSRPDPVGVMYEPVRDKKELAAWPLLVTVRIIRAAPSENYADQQFSIKVTSNAALVCEPVEMLSVPVVALPSPSTTRADRQAASTNDPAATVQRQSTLAQVRSLLDEGRSLQGALDRAPPPTVPPGLPERVEGWEMTVRAGLKSRPDLCARFEAAQFVSAESLPDTLSNRLRARLEVTEAFEQELVEAGG